MATIVEYCATKKPLNAYPNRIVSPARPQACCAVHMVQVGSLHHDERGNGFHYRRCRVCGFAIRHFLPVELPVYVPAVGRRVQWFAAEEQVA